MSPFSFLVSVSNAALRPTVRKRGWNCSPGPLWLDIIKMGTTFNVEIQQKLCNNIKFKFLKRQPREEFRSNRVSRPGSFPDTIVCLFVCKYGTLLSHFLCYKISIVTVVYIAFCEQFLTCKILHFSN